LQRASELLSFHPATTIDGWGHIFIERTKVFAVYGTVELAEQRPLVDKATISACKSWWCDALAGPLLPPANNCCLETVEKLLCRLKAAMSESHSKVIEYGNDPSGSA
jgi:hypothetical protein